MWANIRLACMRFKWKCIEWLCVMHGHCFRRSVFTLLSVCCYSQRSFIHDGKFNRILATTRSAFGPVGFHCLPLAHQRTKQFICSFCLFTFLHLLHSLPFRFNWTWLDRIWRDRIAHILCVRIQFICAYRRTKYTQHQMHSTNMEA